MNRNLENQVKIIDTLLRRKEQLIFRNNSLIQINYLVEQVWGELENLSPDEIALIPTETIEKLFNINNLQSNSFEMLILLLKELIRWKCSLK